MSADLIVRLNCDAPNCSNRLTVPTRDIRLARQVAEQQRDWIYKKREDLCRVHARKQDDIPSAS